MTSNLISGQVTIVVPVYNREALIGPCLDSIIAQTYENLKIIVVDDGSTDSTVARVKRYAEEDDRIFFLLTPQTQGR